MARKAAAGEYYDVEEVRGAAQGLWPDVVSALTGVERDSLNPRRHGPCPKCGGTDRFRAMDDFAQTGGLLCNQCFSEKNGDGFAALMWLNGVNFQDAIKLVARFVGVKPRSGEAPKQSSTADPSERLEFVDWHENLVWLWTLEKPPATVEGVQAIGGRLAKFRKGKHHVIAFPIYGEDNKPGGWAIYQTNGKPLPTGWDKNEQRFTREEKMLCTTGSKPGLIGEVDLLDKCLEATVIFVEGTPDILALHWILSAAGAGSQYVVLTNSNGTNQKPLDWIVKKLAGRRVVVIRDADTPGETGAARWVAGLIDSASEVRNPKLPYPVVENHGPDLRDWINEGHTYEDFLAWITAAPVIEKSEAIAAAAEETPEESDDDPHRLARIYIERHAWHREHGQTLRYWRSEWWRWNGKRYQKLPEEEIRAELTNAIKLEFDRCCRLKIEAYDIWKASTEYEREKDKGIPKPIKVVQYIVTNTLGAIKGLAVVPAYLNPPTWFEDEQTAEHRTCIAMENGILDVDKLLAGQEDCLLPHTPKWFSPICLPYKFDPEADCPRWNAFMEKNLEMDPERIKLLQEWAGYCLLPDTGHQKFVVLEGEGANGKSVFCAALEAMLGRENVSHVPLEIFGQRFALTQTLGKLANIVAECGEMDKAAEGYLKQYTSGDAMFFDRKGIAGLDAVPTARLTLATNNRPRFSDRSGGLWRRMMLIPWRIEIPEADRVVGMDKAWWWEETGELPGIMRWALIGLHRLRQQKRFTASGLCKTALEDYRSESNPAREFLTDNCEQNEFFSILTQDLYSSYKKWCFDHGYHHLGERMFGREVARIFPNAKKKRTRENGSLKYEYSGIDLKTEVLT
jgi:P4 family phage/plasmid primase-like protien